MSLITLDATGIGIIDGDSKRLLQLYVNETIFRQRKSYNEFYMDQNMFVLDLDIDDLMRLSRCFNIEVFQKSISITVR